MAQQLWARMAALTAKEHGAGRWLGPALLALALLPACVGVPALDTFKYATQQEREDALLAETTPGTDAAGADDATNDTILGDVVDAGADADTAAAETDTGPAEADAGAETAETDAADAEPADADAEPADADTAEKDTAETDTAGAETAGADADGEVTGDATTDSGSETAQAETSGETTSGDADAAEATGDAGPADGTDGDGDAAADSGPDVPPPECVTATDCSGKWTGAELGACHAADCSVGVCVQKAVSGPCDDGSVCTASEACSGGFCSPITFLSCDDGDACTADKCDASSGCFHVGGSAGCDDGNACTADDCDASNACVHLAIAATCSDDNACTLGDACTETVCASVDVQICNDENLCTNDSCAAASGCVYLANAVTCDDGDVCTVADACGGKECVPGAVDKCDDGNTCTDDLCTTGSGCANTDNFLACDDGNKCTPGDTCQGGACVGLAVAATAFCNDSNVCTDDSCDPTSGCAHSANTASCEDGLPCTVGDVCAGSKCTAGVSACECKKDADCATKEDGNPCNGTLMCDLATAPYKCVVAPSTVVVCNAQNDTTCVKNTCSLATGLCSYKAQNEGNPCDADGTVCTVGDLCQGGDCKAGEALNCNDGLVCTSDSCDKVNGCQVKYNSNPCSDGNACTVGDACAGGTCGAGTLTVCDDKNPCTTDSCSTSSGNCTYTETALGCDDGNACSSGDVCKPGGVCVGAAITCDDNLVCTSDSCNTATGCVYAANTLACNDNNACTTADTCAAKACVGLPVVATQYCDDGNVCTTDTCAAIGGCAHANLNGGESCDDNNSCTVGDTCAGGKCTSGTNNCGCTVTSDCLSKEDANVCNGTLYCDTSAVPYNCKVSPATIITCSTANDTTCRKNTCDPGTGACSFVAQNPGQGCDADGTVCTSGDNCQGTTCAAGTLLVCNDNNVCTTDSCDAVTGCKYVANSAACSDGNACTVGDICANTSCTAGAPTLCDDHVLCTTDSCNTVNGNCVFANNTIGCDDGSVCTTADKCQNGGCVGTTVNCNDNLVCTDDSCHAINGCQYAANTANCTDGNACTLGDVCANKACQPGPSKDCADGKLCTTDSCNTTNGNCVNANNTVPCDDGTACTSADVCGNGLCAGTVISCDDGDACTTDSCNAVTGCKSTLTVTCDDGNACTADTCVPADGSCVHDAKSLYGTSCVDNNQCSTGDYCWYKYNNKEQPDYDAPPYCASGVGWGCDDANGCTWDNCDYTAANPTCTHAAAGEGSQCGDCATTGGVLMFTGGSCQSGTCKLATAPVTCDDGNVCSKDTCDFSYGCAHNASFGYCYNGQTCPAGTTCWNGSCMANCDDGSVCTSNDICNWTMTCSGTTVCDDGNSCTADSCSVAGIVAVCAHVKLEPGSACDDGNACTYSEVCDASGGCGGGLPSNCDDNNKCSTELCDKYQGCLYTYLGGSSCVINADCPSGGVCLATGTCYFGCDDGNPCTYADSCNYGSCLASAIPGAKYCGGGSGCGAGGSCINSYCGPDCDDGNPCTLNDTCANATCGGAQNTCDDQDSCTVDSCNQASGQCSHSPLCDDGNPCTDDGCTAASGCTGHPNSPEGTWCGAASTCVSGSCTACTPGTMAIQYDNNGKKSLACAFDYPAWGNLPLSPGGAPLVSNGQTTSDPRTGLMWQTGYNAATTWDAAPAVCDALTLGGYYDWRMPTPAEIQSITDYAATTIPALAVSGLTNPAGNYNNFWTWVGYPGWDAWYVYWGDGTGAIAGNSNNYYSRCVRTATKTNPPAARWVVNGAGTEVADMAQGLVWQRTASTSTFTQAAAVAWCNNTNNIKINGLAARLPNVRELQSIVDRTNFAAGVLADANAFPDIKQATSPMFWSATPTASSAGFGWMVNFANFAQTVNQSTGTAGGARCVLSCDDNNPCTTDAFDPATWSCTHGFLNFGTACNGGGTCSLGTCTCGGNTRTVAIDDAGTARTVCAYDYPAWGNQPLQPNKLTALSDGTVFDSLTGLQWANSFGASTTQPAAASSTGCDGLNLAGKTDWRLPTLTELLTIVDYSQSGSAMLAGAFVGGSGQIYWTSTPVSGVSSNTWAVNFGDGSTLSTPSGNTYAYRCVRGLTPITVTSTRLALVSSTVVDSVTKLTWAQSINAAGNQNHSTQQSYCSNLVLASATWRLPNVRELASTMDFTVNNPTPFQSWFNTSPASSVLTTSTPRAANWYTVGAAYGQVSFSSTNTNVRCVHD